MALASNSGDQSKALILACPVQDIRAAAEVENHYGMALLPAGGLGDLETCGLLPRLYLLEILSATAAPAATWLAELLASVPLSNPDPGKLLPSTWQERHPDAYSVARGLLEPSRGGATVEIDPDDFPEAGERIRQQVFLPVSGLTSLPKHDWLFTNELVRKQTRRGRTFAPRAPTLITIPD